MFDNLMPDDFEMDDFFTELAVIDAESECRADELFGNSDGSDLSDDEIEIIFSNTLTHKEKLAKLSNLRAEKTVKPRNFAKRLTKAGRVHAKGMGIKL